MRINRTYSYHSTGKYERVTYRDGKDLREGSWDIQQATQNAANGVHRRK